MMLEHIHILRNMGNQPTVDREFDSYGTEALLRLSCRLYRKHSRPIRILSNSCRAFKQF